MQLERIHRPYPLYWHPLRLGVVLSAKSGCTFATRWFLHHIGQLEAAVALHEWVHEYRNRVFYAADHYRRDLRHLFDAESRVLRVVRNPYSRVVSSYLHVVRFGYELDEIGAFLGREVGFGAGISFREWVDYIGSQDLRRANTHHRVQVHAWEREGRLQGVRVLHLEAAAEELNGIEREWGLPVSDTSRFRSSVHHTERARHAGFAGDEVMALGPNYTGPLPDTDAFYDDGLRARVAELYADDFERYGYAT